jgi:hypothetical protein
VLHQSNKFDFSFFKVMNPSFHFRGGLVLVALALLLSCDKPEPDSPDLPPAKEVNADGLDSASKGNEKEGKKEKLATKPLSYGAEVRELDPSSELYKKIVEKIRTLEEADQHEIQFMAELEEGGIEVKTRMPGKSYGYAILVKVDEHGVVEIVEKAVWRA